MQCNHCERTITTGDSLVNECVEEHCGAPLRFHPSCHDLHSPMFCAHHRSKYRKRWLVRFMSAAILLGGGFCVGYMSASIANHLCGYFSYAPSIFYPHRLQVLVHSLSWLTVVGAVSYALDWKSNQSSATPLPRSQPEQRHYYHYYPLFSQPSQQVIIHNGNDSKECKESKESKDSKYSHDTTPLEVTKYESPGFIALTFLGAGACFGVYHLWSRVNRFVEFML